jgi:hypothetical protein
MYILGLDLVYVEVTKAYEATKVYKVTKVYKATKVYKVMKVYVRDIAIMIMEVCQSMRTAIFAPLVLRMSTC